MEGVGQEPVFGYLCDPSTAEVTDPLFEPDQASGVVRMLNNAEERLTNLPVERRIYAFQTLRHLFEIEESPSTGTLRNDHCYAGKRSRSSSTPTGDP